MPETSIEEVAQHAAATGRIALDTEFMSEGRYFARLCLVQFAVEGAGGETLVGTIDTLADDDPGPILPALSDPGVEVVVHAGRQDLGLLQREWRANSTNVFDTQIAAALTSTSQQSSYQFLVSNLLGKSLQKSESFTRWDQRPLTPKQLAYARQDVEHLLPMAAALRERLDADGRLEWAREECRLLETVAAEERDPEEVFRRLAAGTDLSPVDAAVARELVFWREQTAREQDRPDPVGRPGPHGHPAGTAAPHVARRPQAGARRRRGHVAPVRKPAARRPAARRAGGTGAARCQTGPATVVYAADRAL